LFHRPLQREMHSLFFNFTLFQPWRSNGDLHPHVRHVENWDLQWCKTPKRMNEAPFTPQRKKKTPKRTISVWPEVTKKASKLPLFSFNSFFPSFFRLLFFLVAVHISPAVWKSLGTKVQNQKQQQRKQETKTHNHNKNDELQQKPKKKHTNPKHANEKKEVVRQRIRGFYDIKAGFKKEGHFGFWGVLGLVT